MSALAIIDRNGAANGNPEKPVHNTKEMFASGIKYIHPHLLQRVSCHRGLQLLLRQAGQVVQTGFTGLDEVVYFVQVAIPGQ